MVKVIQLDKNTELTTYDKKISIPHKKAFYEWAGNYWKEIPTADIKKGIAVELAQGKKPVEDGSELEKIFNYRLALNYPGSDKLKQSKGINCVNGVLELDWVENEPKFSFRAHNPKVDFYFHKPVVMFDPEADEEFAEKLLECLPLAERTILLRTIASAFDVAGVRARLGRLIRAMFLSGGGNNGKDTLRECFAKIFGKHSFTALTLGDFEAYDKGKRFNLAPLYDAVVNWAPEAISKTKIDSLSCLKGAITGEELYCENKYQNAFKYDVETLFLFNTNHHIYAQASTESFWSRFVLLKFSKEYKDNPGVGELKADPRYKYDPMWVEANVLPALLNILIQEFGNLMEQGIDFTVSNENWKHLKMETSHLYDFAQEIGLEYDPDGSEHFISCGVLWAQLQHYYLNTGVIESFSDELPQSPRAGDPYIKAANRMGKAIQELFPKAKQGYCRTGDNRKRTSGFFNLKMANPYELDRCFKKYCPKEYRGIRL